MHCHPTLHPGSVTQSPTLLLPAKVGGLTEIHPDNNNHDFCLAAVKIDCAYVPDYSGSAAAAHSYIYGWGAYCEQSRRIRVFWTFGRGYQPRLTGRTREERRRRCCGALRRRNGQRLFQGPRIALLLLPLLSRQRRRSRRSQNTTLFHEGPEDRHERLKARHKLANCVQLTKPSTSFWDQITRLASCG